MTISCVTTYCLIANPPTGRTTPQKRLFSVCETIYFGLQTTEMEPLWSFWTCRPRSILLIMKSSSIVSMGTVASLAKRSAGTSYLRGRTQVVKIDKASSQKINIRFGLPQGSVLCGTLFTIYICQLPSATATDGVTIDGFSDDAQARIRLPLTKDHSPSPQLTTCLSLLSTCKK